MEPGGRQGGCAVELQEPQLRGWVAHRLAVLSPCGARTGAKENPVGKQFHANLSNL